MQQLHQSLSEQMRIGDHEIERRKFLLDLTQADFSLLKSCQKWIESDINTIVEQFYIQQTAIPEIAVVIGDKETLNNLHNSMVKYIQELFSGNYDKNYVNKRLRIGKIHHRIGVSPKLYLSGISQLQQIIEQYINRHADEPEPTMRALRKLFYFDNQLVFDTYIASLQSEVESANSQLEEYASNLEKNVAERTEELTQLSMRDPLTQLYNQRAFYEELDRSVEIANRTENHVTLLYVDLNKFKEVNDKYGHKAGDEVLVTFATAVNNILRKSETASRYGGDEFCIVMPNTHIENAHHLCSRLANSFAEQCNYGVTLSIGGASIYPDCGFGIEKLIQLADTQMYAAKQLAHKSNTSEFSFEPRKKENNVSQLA